MSLLSICTTACQAAPISAPTAIVGNTDETATLLLAVANQAGQSLFRRPQGGWITMIREFDFVTAAVGVQTGTIANSGPGGTAVVSGLSGISAVQPNSWVATGTGVARNTVVSAVTPSTVTLSKPATSTGSTQITFCQADYTLPADFQRPVDNTFWDRTRFWQMRGPMTPQAWQLFKSSVMGLATIQRRYRFRSANWLSGGTGTAGTQVLSIDPTPFDAGAQLVFEYVSNGWCQSATGVVQSSWQADTDVGVLDEYLLQLGVQWRLFRRLGIGYSEELDDYEREVDKAVAQDGAAPILNLTPGVGTTLIGPWSVPESGFGGVPVP